MMHDIALARQKLRARIQDPSTPRPVRLAHNLVETGQSRYLPILSSKLARDILSRGYDARTLDRIYTNEPSGDFGLVGRLADRMVLDFPVHQGLRERLDAAVGEISAAAVLAIRAGEPEFRVLCAPCGLGSEMLGVARRLKEARPETFSRMRWWGVDPDPEGLVLPMAARRAFLAGLRVEFIREDLRRRREVRATAEREGRFHLVCSLGLTSGLAELQEQLAFYAEITAPGGTLLIDRWQPAEKSKLAVGLGLDVPCHPAGEFQALLEAAGFTVEREHATGEGGCVLTTARRRPGE